MPGDKRRIQTAVLGSAESDEPLLLPLEAIELDAFRRQHAADTFWCGLLLGGCGTQLTTKLYTDRVCHFAHFPDPTGLHVCERRARDVTSADHLYAKSAAAAWLKARRQRASISYGTPLGSTVDILWGRQARGLRLHLDSEVPPVWDDEAVEPVLGVSVPVDDETLVHRWYVHRVGFDTVGTARRVRIGTQAFARETEWFGLDECSMTPDGFRTPAVERIIAARRTHAPQGVWRPPAPQGQQTQSAHRVHPALRRLEAAMEFGSRVAVQSACRDLEAAGPDWGPATEEITTVLDQAQSWLVEHHREREEMFGQLRQAVRDSDWEAARALLNWVDAHAARDRTPEHHVIATQAEAYLQDQGRQERWAREAEAREAAAKNARRSSARNASRERSPVPRSARSVSPPPTAVDPAEAAHQRVRHILGDLRRLGTSMGPRTMLHMLDSLATTMKSAGARVTPAQREEAQLWLARGRRLRGATAGKTVAVPRKAAGVPTPRLGVEAGTAGRGAATGRVTQGKGNAASVPAKGRTASAERPERSKKKTPASPPRLPARSIASVAAAVAGALKKAARERSTSSWSRLHRQLGSALPDLHPDDRMEVLVCVEAGTAAEEPLLSSLLAADGSSPPALYQGLARRLGRTIPADTREARAHWQSEVLRLHQLFRYR
ncbi:hypothetical protein ACIG0C_30100 [Kitasatospora aureofaciens]|uniref:Uncharacterized protein n=1 Tax=Kitasatospora aureofaciens TaxID=1894 RepID=A0A8H9LYB8_KITAU|nr:hypothetical protein [Kitasatospora aureofaciens]GGU99283.1 hypothetical protein GCM10010502_62130 [Kitasatospora aureofaciens]